jgi:uncharacterized membrane protein YkvA (DUF1232 family)
MNAWQGVLALLSGFALLWIALVVSLYLVGRRQADPTRLRDALRLVPDVARLLRRLTADPTLPRGVRIRLMLLLVYLALPIDLVPDFIPVVGYADDAVVVAIALRSVARRAGVEAIDRHWPGTPEGLLAVKQVAGLPTAG